MGHLLCIQTGLVQSGAPIPIPLFTWESSTPLLYVLPIFQGLFWPLELISSPQRFAKLHFSTALLWCIILTWVGPPRPELPLFFTCSLLSLIPWPLHPTDFFPTKVDITTLATSLRTWNYILQRWVWCCDTPLSTIGTSHNTVPTRHKLGGTKYKHWWTSPPRGDSTVQLFWMLGI